MIFNLLLSGFCRCYFLVDATLAPVAALVAAVVETPVATAAPAANTGGNAIHTKHVAHTVQAVQAVQAIQLHPFAFSVTTNSYSFTFPFFLRLFIF